MESRKNITIIKNLLKRLVLALCAGLIVMWGVFWYISGSPSGLFRFFFTYYVTEQYFMTPVPRSELFEGALKGIVASLDEPHSQYLDQDEFRQMMEQTEGSYSGVGIVMGKREKGIEVIAAIDDQPAAKAGIKAGDVIVSVDGTPTDSLSLEEVSKKVRGEAGTTVVLGISRDGKIQDYTLTREHITLPTVKGRMLEDGIGYIRISQFADKTGDEFAAEYKALQQQGMKKLVLDLRNNPGGLLTAARDVGDYILPKGPIVTIQGRSGVVESYDSNGLEPKIPLAVLINKGSASASEIIAGAVQDEKAGTIVGTTSYGKGTVQTIIGNMNKEAIKITIAKYHTPGDRVIDGIGIKPDVEVQLPEHPAGEADDTQLQKSVEILKAEK